jgi:hypothetical protein
MTKLNYDPDVPMPANVKALRRIIHDQQYRTFGWDGAIKVVDVAEARVLLAWYEKLNEANKSEFRARIMHSQAQFEIFLSKAWGHKMRNMVGDHRPLDPICPDCGKRHPVNPIHQQIKAALDELMKQHDDKPGDDK